MARMTWIPQILTSHDGRTATAGMRRTSWQLIPADLQTASAIATRLEIDRAVFRKIGLPLGAARLKETSGMVGGRQADRVQPSDLVKIANSSLITAILNTKDRSTSTDA
jgi:hypothetical protein